MSEGQVTEKTANVLQNTEKILLLWSNQLAHSYKDLTALLEACGWTVESLIDTRQLYNYSRSQSVCCLAIFQPKQYQFSVQQIRDVNEFCDQSYCRSLWISADGHYYGVPIVQQNRDYAADSVQGPQKDEYLKATNLNPLLRRFGLSFNRDIVLRPNPLQGFHPREAHLDDYVANQGLAEAMARYEPGSKSSSEPDRVLYPSGCTLNVHMSKFPGTVVVMSTNKMALPQERGLCALCTPEDQSTGPRVIALGSAAMLSDAYLKQARNRAFAAALADFVGWVNSSSSRLMSNNEPGDIAISRPASGGFQINASDARTLELASAGPLAPDWAALVEIPVASLHQWAELPEDKRDLLADHKLFGLDGLPLERLLEAREWLGVTNSHLSLIKPRIQVTPLQLEPATHGFLLCDLEQLDENTSVS